MRELVSFLFLPNYTPGPGMLGHSLLGGCGLTERWGRESGGWSGEGGLEPSRGRLLVTTISGTQPSEMSEAAVLCTVRRNGAM